MKISASLRSIGIVLHKELLDGFRDRRSLLAALMYSLFGPLILVLVLSVVAKRADETTPLPLAVAGGERAPHLLAALATSNIRAQPAPADVEGAVRRGELDVALVVHATYTQDFAAMRPARIELVYESSRGGVSPALARVERALERYGDEVARLRWLARGLSPELATPLRLERQDLAGVSPRALQALMILSMFLLLAAFYGAMNLAIDSTAGERERHTLEALLVQPIARWVIVAGKWLASSVLAITSLALTLLVCSRVLASERFERLDLGLALEGAQAVRLLVLLLPLGLLAPALQMLAAVFARSYKEAQTYVTLLTLAPMVPGMLLSTGASEVAAWMRRTPLLGQQVLISDVLRGEAASAGALSLLTVGAALAAVSMTAWLLGRERVVLGR